MSSETSNFPALAISRNQEGASKERSDGLEGSAGKCSLDFVSTGSKDIRVSPLQNPDSQEMPFSEKRKTQFPPKRSAEFPPDLSLKPKRVRVAQWQKPGHNIINSNNVYINTQTEGSKRNSPPIRHYEKPNGIDSSGVFGDGMGVANIMMNMGSNNELQNGSLCLRKGSAGKTASAGFGKDAMGSPLYDGFMDFYGKEMGRESSPGSSYGFAENNGSLKNKSEKMGSDFMNEQQLKMFQSVKMMHQHPNRSMTPDMNSMYSPVESLTPKFRSPLMSDYKGEFSPVGSPPGSANRSSNSRADTLENLNRSYFVRKCADELYKIKPRYKMVIQSLLKKGLEEVNTINQTVRLYSQILCNWKKQTMFVYSKMQNSLVSLQYQLENEMARGRVLYSNYHKQINNDKRRNEMLEANLKRVQAELIVTRRRIKQGNENRNIEKDGSNSNESKFLHEKSREVIEALSEENSNLKAKLEKLEKQSKKRSNETKKAETDSMIVSSAEEVVQIFSSLQCLESRIASPEGEDIVKSTDEKNTKILIDLKTIKNKLEKVISGEGPKKVSENFIVSSNTKNVKDLIEAEKILAKRVLKNGKTQFYVSCRSNSASPGEVSPGEMPCSEKVWVDEGDLAGSERMIERYFDQELSLAPQ